MTMELDLVVDRLDALGLYSKVESYIELLEAAGPKAASIAAIVYMAGFVSGRIFKENDEFRIFLDGIKTFFDPAELMYLSLEDFETRLQASHDDFARGFYDARFLFERLWFVTSE